MPLSPFHPAVAAWFRSRFGSPTEPQERAWPSIVAGRNTLVAAPTGSGKTLAAFLAAIDQLVRASLAGELGDETRVVYVSPLKALSNDIQRNLEEPLAEIRRELAARGLPDAPIRTLVRTGDTPANVRAAMSRKPPHILVTTPESLFILLTSEGGRRARAPPLAVAGQVGGTLPRPPGRRRCLRWLRCLRRLRWLRWLRAPPGPDRPLRHPEPHRGGGAAAGGSGR